jgi:hypothetical protein
VELGDVGGEKSPVTVMRACPASVARIARSNPSRFTVNSPPFESPSRRRDL